MDCPGCNRPMNAIRGGCGWRSEHAGVAAQAVYFLALGALMLVIAVGTARSGGR